MPPGPPVGVGVTVGVKVGVGVRVGVGVSDGLTVVWTVAMLFPTFGSGVEDETPAVWVIVVEVVSLVVTVTTIVTVANPGVGMVPRLAVTTLVEGSIEQLPWLTVQDGLETWPTGSWSVTTTFSAALGPVLLTWIE